MRKRSPERKRGPEIKVDGSKRMVSHLIWHTHTGHWPSYPDEVVHHIDGDPKNNRFENLQLMTRSEHSLMHNNGENNSFFAKTHTKESKAKMSAAKMGNKNPSWKGDDATPDAKYHRIWSARKRVVPNPPVRYEWEVED